MYRRAVLYFIVYSAAFFFITETSFLSLKSFPYFLIGFALSGVVVVFFRSIQHWVEEKFSSHLWALNIILEVVGYFIFTRLLFYLFF